MSDDEMDTFDHIIGSGALSFPWYQDISVSPEIATDNAADYAGWSVTGSEHDTGPSGRHFSIGHKEIMRAMRAMIAKNRPPGVSHEAVRESRNFLFRRDDTDFDASTADEVFQLAAFGEVIYG